MGSKSITTGDANLIKKINTAIVLEAILTGAPLSRAQISERTGLNKATVSSLVQLLLDDELAVEIGQGVSSGGRKPVMLLFNNAAGHAIGIDLGVNYIRGLLADLAGNPLAEHTIAVSTQQPAAVLELLHRCIDELIRQAPSSRYGIVGIGVGVPGLVDEQGTILFAPNLGWEHIPLQQQLADHYAMPVIIDNEANAGAQGEQRYGAGRGIANQIYVSVGIGIGTGLIIQGNLYKGTSGFSGELGHLSIDLNGKLCRCGNRGCWELYASENALLEQAGKLGLGLDSLASLLEAAEQGNPQVQSLFDNIGEYLGIGIANIANIFNPEAVIIGNRMRLGEPWLATALEATIARRTLPYHRTHMRLLFAELGEQSAVRGAAYYAIRQFFKQTETAAVLF